MSRLLFIPIPKKFRSMRKKMCDDCCYKIRGNQIKGIAGHCDKYDEPLEAVAKVCQGPTIKK